MRRLTALVLALATAPLVAQDPNMAPWATPDVTRIVAGRYTVEPSHAQAIFQVDHLGISPYYGSFDGLTGTLVIDPATPARAQVDVTIPVASVRTSVAALDEKLKSAEWLDAARFPTMRFRSTGVRVGPDRLAAIDGELTLHGVTKPATVQARLVGAGTDPFAKSPVLGFEGRARIRRSDFGVSYGIPAVSDEITILIALPFERKG